MMPPLFGYFQYKQGRIKSQPTVGRFYSLVRIKASISFTIPSSTLNHLILGSDSLNQLACLRTNTRVARRISAFASSSLNSPLITRMHSRYPIADIVGRLGE